MLLKTGKLEADAYILDLEDSIPNYEKDNALGLLCNFLESHINSNVKIIVRINKDNYFHELERLKRFEVAFMLPKFEETIEYAKLPVGKEYYALIETPKGLMNIEKIVACDYVTALAFGAEDFTASIGMDNNDQLLQCYKSQVVMYAKAYEKKVYDTPSFVLDDHESFEREVENARALGFDGKMAISPKHIGFINKTFSISDIEYLNYVIKTYESCEDAVQVIDGKIYEKMHVNHLKKILREKG